MRETEFAPLDFRTAPLAGNVLVEASAGTGKTWTIAALVLRLLLEKRFDGRPCRIEDILVVTYTNAATAELRERILALLGDTRGALASGSASDPRIAHALAVAADHREDALAALDLAIASFDLAPVHTIHGFCQRVLADHAFESARPFAAEILADQSALRETAAQDFWRRELAAVSAERASELPRPVRRSRRAARAHRAGARPAVRRGARAARGARSRGRARRARSRVRARVRAVARRAREDRRRDRKCPVAPGELSAGRTGTVVGGIRRILRRRQRRAIAEEAGQARARGARQGYDQGGRAAGAPVFSRAAALLDAAAALEDARAAADRDVMQRALAFCRSALARRKRELGKLGYEDLLLDLRDALRGAGGAELAATLRTRYRAALIDEFQDTDPTQAEILEHIWGKRATAVLRRRPEAGDLRLSRC
ncbi:MAG: UvrD-helicase domain-containing protein [Burkholderiales bacterium]|nr:UvrD-helicase domain-containing protein [Burkholderiales bacterium]